MTNQTDEFVWGAGNIAKAIGRTRRQVYGMLENGALPAKLVHGRWVANRRALIEALTVETTPEMEAA